MKPTLLILAAGMGSRYGGLKQVDQVGPSGETIIDYSIYDALKAGFGKIVFVIRREIEHEFRELFINKLKNRVEIAYVFQDIDHVPEGIFYNKERTKPWGTAHAILVAKDQIHEPFAVINADDYYGYQSYQVMAEFLKTNKSDNEMAMVGFQLKKTLSDYGMVSRGVCQVNKDGFLEEITERTNIEKSDKAIRYKDEDQQNTYLIGDETVSMNFWGFRPSIFNALNSHFSDFLRTYGSEKKKEFYIPIMIMSLIKMGSLVHVLESGESWFGVTYKDDKPHVIKEIKAKIQAGNYPAKLWS